MSTERNKLIDYINIFFNELELYDDYKNGHRYKDLLHASIISFLEYESTYTANEIYENFFMIYQITDEDKSEEGNAKNDHVSESNALLKLVSMMKDYEDNTGDLVEKQRDHFIHSVNVFVLGLSVYACNQRYREEFKRYIKKSPYKKFYKTEDGQISNEEFLYRWGIASLFHDIGYPVEIIGKQLSKFINDGSQSISSKYKVNTAINFRNFNELNSIVKIDPKFPIVYRNDYPETNFINLYKPTEIMAHQIFIDLYVGIGKSFKDFDKKSAELKKLVKHLNNFVNYMAKNNFIDHGFFSSIFVLNSYAAIMQKYYQNQKYEKYAYFFYPVANSACSILLHNYYRGTLQNEEFGLGKLRPNQNPLAYLLIFCDELQEWNRRPIGIKDKEKNHVNNIKIDISKDDITVNYILKNSALGLNFSEDKESLINKLLDVKSIFSNGLKVKIDIDLDKDSPLEDISITEYNPPTILLRNIEEIARASHARYNEEEVKKGNKSESYDEMDASKKLSSVRQAKEYPKKLNMIGCEIVSRDDPRAEHVLTDDEVNFLAILEHDDWMREKINVGWISPDEAIKEGLINDEQYKILMDTNKEGYTDNINNKYEDKDKNLKVHANLIPFEDLNSDSKEKDRRPIREIPIILGNIKNNPLKIVDTKIKMLTVKMHETFKEFISGQESISEFNELPFEIQHNNYKQTHLILKFLSELKYEVVDIADERKGISELKENEIEYLAKREHNSWYVRKLTEGYTFGDKKEGNKSPKIKPWDELDLDSKDSNLNTFENLIDNCLAVGLKII